MREPACGFLRILGDATGHDEAGRQSLDVPFEGGRQRLVEVVDVEDRQSLGRRVGAEIGEMRVAAGLHANAGRWRAGQIRGHHGGGTAQEGKGIGAHPPIADRQQLLDPALALFDQDFDGVGPVGRTGPIHPARCAALRGAALPRHSGGRPDCGSPSTCVQGQGWCP